MNLRGHSVIRHVLPGGASEVLGMWGEPFVFHRGLHSGRFIGSVLHPTMPLCWDLGPIVVPADLEVVRKQS